MAKIGKSFTFEAAHRLQLHNGKCRGLHGHSYRVEVSIEGSVQEAAAVGDDSNPATGMVLDFGYLNNWWKPIETVLDHSTILEGSDPLVTLLSTARIDGTRLTLFDFAPTAENLAAWILNELQAWLLEIWPGGFVTPTVRVYETAKSWAEA